MKISETKCFMMSFLLYLVSWKRKCINNTCEPRKTKENEKIE